MEENCMDWLPPELLNKIFDKLDSKQVVQLRLVSKYWKDVVDIHQTFAINMDGLAPLTIPGPSLKFHTLYIKNFILPNVVQLPELSNQMNRLENLRLTGPNHPEVVQLILQGAVNLKRLEIEESGLKYKGVYYSSFPLNNTKRLENIIIKKESIVDYASASEDQVLEQIVVINRFFDTVSKMLHQSTFLPILTKLSLNYEGLPIFYLQNMVTATIIPFVQRHCSSLKTLHVSFTTLMDTATQDQNSFPSVEPPHPHGLPLRLTSLALRLPDAILNRLLVGIYNNNNNTNSKSVIKNDIPSMSHIVCIWEKPYVLAPSQTEELAYKIVQLLIRENEAKLKVLHLENFNSNSIILYNDTVGCYDFRNLEKMGIGGRNDNGHIHRDIVPLYQVKLGIQHFSNVVQLSVYNVCLKLKPLTKNILQNCNSLEALTLSGNKYYDNVKVESELLIDLALKQKMRIISIGIEDFCTPFDSNYWDEFKDIFGFYEWENDNYNNCIILRL